MLNDFAVRVIEDHPSRVRLVADGEIDMAVAPQLQASLLAAAEAYDDHHIDLDLSGVTFMDSSGLAVLLFVHRRLALVRSHFAVVNPPPVVVKLIELSGIDTFLDVRTTSESCSSSTDRRSSLSPVGPAPVVEQPH